MLTYVATVNIKYFVIKHNKKMLTQKELTWVLGFFLIKFLMLHMYVAI